MTTNNSQAQKNITKAQNSDKQQVSALHRSNEQASSSMWHGWPSGVDWDALFDKAIRRLDETLLQEQLEAIKPRGGKYIIRIKKSYYVCEENGEEICQDESDYLTDVEEIFSPPIEFRAYVYDGPSLIGVQFHHGNGRGGGEYDAPGDYIMKPGEKISYETHGTSEEDHIIIPFHSFYEVELFGWSDELFTQCFRVL